MQRFWRLGGQDAAQQWRDALSGRRPPKVVPLCGSLQAEPEQVWQVINRARDRRKQPERRRGEEKSPCTCAFLWSEPQGADGPVASAASGEGAQVPGHTVTSTPASRLAPSRSPFHAGTLGPWPGLYLKNYRRLLEKYKKTQIIRDVLCSRIGRINPIKASCV